MQPGVFSAANAAQSNSSLTLRAQYDPGYSFPTNNDSCGCPYSDVTTAVLYSLATIKYGYVEIKAKAAKVNGLQSGFFLQGTQSYSGVVCIYRITLASLSLVFT